MRFIGYANNVEDIARMGIDRTREKQQIAKDKLLGKVADSDPRWSKLYFGVSDSLVGSVRRSLGIPAYKAPGGHIKHPRRPEIEADPMLGKVHDWRLARKYKCSRFLIGDIRREKMIPPTKKGADKPLPDWRQELFKRVGWC